MGNQIFFSVPTQVAIRSHPLSNRLDSVGAGFGITYTTQLYFLNYTLFLHYEKVFVGSFYLIALGIALIIETNINKIQSKVRPLLIK